jgi:hypothetical protein
MSSSKKIDPSRNFAAVGGVSHVRDHILQEFYTLYIPGQIQDEATDFHLKAMTCFSRPIT